MCTEKRESLGMNAWLTAHRPLYIDSLSNLLTRIAYGISTVGTVYTMCTIATMISVRLVSPRTCAACAPTDLAHRFGEPVTGLRCTRPRALLGLRHDPLPAGHQLPPRQPQRSPQPNQRDAAGGLQQEHVFQLPAWPGTPRNIAVADAIRC